MTPKQKSRIEKILPILPQLLKDLQSGKDRDVRQMLAEEMEVTERELKDYMPDLAANFPEYEAIAALALQHGTTDDMPASEAKIPLAKLYGIKAYHSAEMPEARKAFFKRHNLKFFDSLRDKNA